MWVLQLTYFTSNLTILIRNEPGEKGVHVWFGKTQGKKKKKGLFGSVFKNCFLFLKIRRTKKIRKFDS